MNSQNEKQQNTLSFRTAALLLFSFVGGCSTLAVGVWLGREAAPVSLPALHAASAASSDSMAVATGQIGKDSEGIFFLDFVTGDLQCLVYYPRARGFGAHYVGNVLQHLGGGGKNANYLMVTGQAVVPSSTGGTRPGASLVYVTDTTSGLFAAYAVPWDMTAESGGRIQSGGLVYVGGGPIRNFQLRDPVKNQPAGIVDPNKK